MTPVVLCLLFITAFFLSAADKFSPPANSSCACPNQVLTFQCIVAGNETIIATLWRGSAFSCPETDANEILLRHSKFDEGTEKSCNNNSIIGQSLSEINQTEYSSQLTVRVGNNLNNKTVGCFVHLNTGMNILRGESLITVTSEPINSVPTRVILTYVETRQLVFTWNAVDFNCSSLNYITNSNCSTLSCVTVTDTAAANCSGLQLPSVCTFSVQTEVCGQIGLSSDPLILTLRVPDKPTLGVIPIYSSEVQDLLRIKVIIQQQASFNISDTMSGSITSYNVSYNSQTANTKMFDRNTSCVEDACEYDINLPSDLCQSSNDISVTLSASNRLGQGLSSNSTMIGCTNQFVEVKYDSTASTITCRFLDERDTSRKLCTVMYGECGRELLQTTQGSSTMETPNNIVLSVDANILECYSVTASSDLVTIIVDSDENSEERGPDVVVTVVVILVVLVVVAIAVSVLVVITIVFITRRRRCSDNGGQLFTTHREKSMQLRDLKSSTSDKDSPQSTDDVQQDRFKLERLSKYDYQYFEVAHDCELRGYVENELKLVKEFKRGCVFYEFSHEFESISDDQELIFSEKDYHGSYWKVGHKDSLIGLQVRNPNFEHHHVFIQCTGFGVQHLPANSRLLCQIKSSPQSKPDPPLKPIVPFNIRSATVTTTMTIKTFCERNGIPTKYGVFLELDKFEKKSDLIDVILQDKESAVMYTGPTARKMVKQYYAGRKVPDLDLDKWSVFVLCQIDENTEIQADSIILYQAPEFTHLSRQVFDVLTVDESENCMCMYDFIKKKPEINEFTDSHAFYELTKEEDLRYYRDIVYLAEGNTTKTHIDLFYRQRDSKPRKKKEYRVFIQSTSQGARCVKHGDTILYKTIPGPLIADDPHRQQPVIDDVRDRLASRL